MDRVNRLLDLHFGGVVFLRVGSHDAICIIRFSCTVVRKPKSEIIYETVNLKRVLDNYRYMYLKTYTKFTFCIKSQRHVSDENFLYHCMYLASKISSYGV